MGRKRLFFSCVMFMALPGAGTALWGQTAGLADVANCGLDLGKILGSTVNIS